MTNPLPIPDDLWAQVPPDAQAAIAAVFLVMQQRIAELETRIGDLEARLKLNSTNSSKLPSPAPIGMKRRPPALASGEKRGGRRGRRMADRALVPTVTLRQTLRCEPGACRRCCYRLGGDDPKPLVHLMAQLPWIEPGVDEHRLPRLTCSGCGETTCGVLPIGVPSGGFGPSLQAVLTLLAGAYRPSKRQNHQAYSDVFAPSGSTGMISQPGRHSTASLESPHDELALAVHRAKAMNIDHTSWGERRRKVRFWVPPTGFAEVFSIVKNRGDEIARVVLDCQDGLVVGSNRCSTSKWITASRRQIRWTQLRRVFQARIDRVDGGESVGGRLLRLSSRLFGDLHRVRNEDPPWTEFRKRRNCLHRATKRFLSGWGAEFVRKASRGL